jgi:hypothetical protein
MLPGRASFINLTQDQVAFRLRTDLVNSLTGEEAARRLRLHGPNLLKKARRTRGTQKLLRNFFSFFAVLLWIAAVLLLPACVDMPQLGAAVLIVIVVNGLFAFFQEYRTDRAVEVLQRLLSLKSKVIRDGRHLSVDAATLVPGDVIVLEQGDIVPADARLTEAFDVEVDNPPSPGSRPRPGATNRTPVLLEGSFLWIELPNIVFAATAFMRGEAGRGLRHEHADPGGEIATTQEIPTELSPLQTELRSTVLLSRLWPRPSGSVSPSRLARHRPFPSPTLVFCIGLFVATSPRPPHRDSLARHGRDPNGEKNALVKSSPRSRLWGRRPIICSDKTGTLTRIG